MQNKAPFVIITLVLVILSLGAGYYLGKTYTSSQVGQNTDNQNSLFSQQTAIIQGQVTKISDRNITIKASNDQTATFPAATQVFINKLSAKVNGTNPLPSPNTNLSSIDIGKDATISLMMNQGQFEVISVTYTPPMNEVIPTSTQSSSPSAKQ